MLWKYLGRIGFVSYPPGIRTAKNQLSCGPSTHWLLDTPGAWTRGEGLLDLLKLGIKDAPAQGAIVPTEAPEEVEAYNAHHGEYRAFKWMHPRVSNCTKLMGIYRRGVLLDNNVRGKNSREKCLAKALQTMEKRGGLRNFLRRQKAETNFFLKNHTYFFWDTPPVKRSW